MSEPLQLLQEAEMKIIISIGNCMISKDILK